MRRAATIPVFLMALVVVGSVLAGCRAVAIAAVEAVLLVAIARPSASCDLRSDPTGLGGTEMTHTTVTSVIMTV